MILIIDSGATNSTWKFIDSKEQSQTIKLLGFNLSTSAIADFQYPEDNPLNVKVKSLFFFGAGTGDENRERLLIDKLIQIFPNCENTYIGSDLHSAGLALSFKEESVISILGTGSNCCLFDGTKIKENVNNLGFILGDEGSGFLMGKMILQDYFYNKMDSQTYTLFQSLCPITRDEVVKQIYYENNRPNSYVASFTKFLIDANTAYRYKIANKALTMFFDDQLKQFKELKGIKYHFSGSISWHFKDIIEALCAKYDLKIGNIIQNPIDSLSYSKLIQIQN